MRAHLVLLSLMLIAGSAPAQSAVDCDAVRNSEIPVEVTFRGQDGTKTIVQAYRDKSGDRVVWSRQTPPSASPTPPVFVTKTTYVDGTIASAELSTPYAGKYSHRKWKYRPDGLPRNFDHRSDITFRMLAVATSSDGSVEERTSTISFKFKSEETIAVGPCDLRVIHGEVDTSSDTARPRHSFQLYFPELEIRATATDAEPVAEGLSTVLSEIRPPN